jgi:hypothetical protein
MERTNDTKQMRQYTVRDNEQTLDFTGVLLAEKDSRVQTKNRWIELRLYRTQAGSYVLEGIGRTTVPGEIDRCWAQVSDEPEGIIERLYLYSENGQRYIPHTSRALLLQASRYDENLAKAYRHQHIA